MKIEKGEKSSKISIKQFFFHHKTVFNKNSDTSSIQVLLEARNVTELNLNQAWAQFMLNLDQNFLILREKHKIF